jgi:F-type H+-transporting ATPase subunit a
VHTRASVEERRDNFMETPHITLYAETLFHIGPIPITNSFLVMIIVMTFLLLLFSWLARKITNDPREGGRAGAFGEMIVEFLLNLVESTGGKKLGRRIFPLVAGLFIFIITANFTGLLPGIGSIYIEKDEPHAEEAVDADAAHTSTEEGEVAEAAVSDVEHAEDDAHASAHVPLFRPPTADLNMTLAMSTITFVAVQVFGVRAHGVGGRLKHMANPPFLFPIEVVSEFSRIISLAARLFGNVFAGEVLLGVAYSIASAVKIAILPLLFPVIFLGLETIFGTIQALVFSLLTLIYIFLAAAGHDDHDESHAESHDSVRAVDDATPHSRNAAVAGD